MKKLYIDFDGVIYNTIEVSYQMAKEAKLTEDYDKYFHFFNDLNWCNVLNKSTQINNAFENIKKLQKKFNVTILTHVVTMQEAETKIKIIRKYLDVPVMFVPKSISKAFMVDAKDAILVDDYNENLKEWQLAGGIPVRFDLDMDPKGYTVIDDLSKLEEMF